MDIKKILWDYNISEKDFMSIICGEKEVGWFNQDWALIRAIERLNYYELKELVSDELLKEKWNCIKNKIWRKDIREGLEFALYRKTLSSAR